MIHRYFGTVAKGGRVCSYAPRMAPAQKSCLRTNRWQKPPAFGLIINLAIADQRRLNIGARCGKRRFAGPIAAWGSNKIHAQNEKLYEPNSGICF